VLFEWRTIVWVVHELLDILVQKLEIHEVTTHTITELLANASLTGGKLLEYAHEVCVGRRKL